MALQGDVGGSLGCGYGKAVHPYLERSRSNKTKDKGATFSQTMAIGCN
jgi:hypothetical protein